MRVSGTTDTWSWVPAGEVSLFRMCQWEDSFDIQYLENKKRKEMIYG